MKTSMWQRRLVIGLLTALAGLAALALAPGLDRVTPANYARVQLGMSELEVFHVLGSPTSKRMRKGFVKGPDTFVIVYDPSLEGTAGYVDFPTYDWETKRLHVLVQFGPDGKVMYRQCAERHVPVERWHESLVRHFRRWVGL